MTLEAPEALGLSYVLKVDGKPSLPNEFVREAEITHALTEHVLKKLAPFSAHNFLEYDEITRSLFEKLLDDNVISVKDTALSGRYFRYNSDRFPQFRSSYLQADPFFVEFKEVGERYYQDAFEAIEQAVIDGAPLPSMKGQKIGTVGGPNLHFFESESRKAEFVAAANTSLRSVETAELSNSDKAQARGYLLAAKALAETPDPPADLIWTILNRANSVAGIASFFVSLLALIAMVVT